MRGSNSPGSRKYVLTVWPRLILQLFFLPFHSVLKAHCKGLHYDRSEKIIWTTSYLVPAVFKDLLFVTLKMFRKQTASLVSSQSQLLS